MNDRRRFLRVLGGATAALALPACTTITTSGGTTSSAASSGAGGAGGAGGSSSTGCPPIGVAVGMPSAYPAPRLYIVPGTGVLIGRDAGGLYALSSICTHQGCDMDEMIQGFPEGSIFIGGIACNCHGSRFDTLGNVLVGPAFSPLVAFQLTLGCDGVLYADKSTVVPNTQRVVA
jgi:Rieske Fe-S protein